MNITKLRLWCRAHDLVVRFTVGDTVYQIDADGLSCTRPGETPCRVRESQLLDLFEQHPDLHFVVCKRSLQGLGQENIWTLGELKDVVGVT